jgi:hypothetical protein
MSDRELSNLRWAGSHGAGPVTPRSSHRAGRDRQRRRFLLLMGFALPLLPDTPMTDLMPITPHQV